MRSALSLVLFCLIVVSLQFLSPTSAFADGEEIGQGDCQIVSGSGSQSDPFVYRIANGSKSSWKHLAEVNDAGTTERYECLSASGAVDYAWLYDAGDIENPAGPFWLQVSRYTGAVGTDALPGGLSAVYFSTANKTDFGGKCHVVLNVSSSWADGQHVALFYYGGISDAVVHGAGNPVDPQEYLLVEDVCAVQNDLVVKDGCVEVALTFGGNYFLVPSDTADAVICTAEKPDVATRGLYESSASDVGDGESTSTAVASNSETSAGAQASGFSASMPVLVSIALAVAVAFAITLVVRRRKRRACKSDASYEEGKTND